ncbi:hypothetical protein [Gorillibacterium sp. sgz5001074]|uniref:hypothetical protein n=1 Tax=Gorillibacterium sp. sgz5001074 TaxID=3446695 RepID=UPI003F66D82B
MKMRIMLFIGSVAIAITITGSKWAEASVVPPAPALPAPESPGIALQSPQAVQDPYHAALGVTSDQDIYDALYDGQTLAGLATERGQDPERIVRLQVAELTAQLEDRLAGGSITPAIFAAQKAELADIVSRSVYGTAAG